MAIGHCLNCDKEILRVVDNKWEDVDYHSITFMKGTGSYIRFPFCKVCHDSWDDSLNEQLKPKIVKHIEEVIRREMEPFLKMELTNIVTKDGPLDEEDKKNIRVVDGGLAWR